MNIFFDVDYTIVDSEGELLRPYVKEVFQQLGDEGHHVYLWSGMGLRWEIVEQHGLRELVRDCFEKPLRNYEQEWARQGKPLHPDYVIDDTPSVVSAFGGFVIPPYAPWKTPDDSEMLRVYAAIKQFAAQQSTGEVATPFA